MSELHDPRVLFAAERTLLAWNRTSVSLMAFGFVVERWPLLKSTGQKRNHIIGEGNFFLYRLDIHSTVNSS